MARVGLRVLRRAGRAARQGRKSVWLVGTTLRHAGWVGERFR